MIIPFKKDQIAAPIDTAFIERLKQIYTAMDSAYQQAADSYEFTCDGCRDNCCRTRFHHHTMIEYIFMVKGLNTLTRKKRNEVQSRALTVVDETTRADSGAEVVRLMCPLNFDELCILYPYRPMICRLHGIPHELKKPGQKPVYGPGCETFNRRCGHKDDLKFDRTPFYREMAMLEQEVKQALAFDGKIRMTVAKMILSIA
jgi:hypothetical protein